jgi:ABC-2 type transport system ATP-binding protein
MTSPFPIDLSSTELGVSTRDVSKWYAGRRALHRVSLHVPTGAVYLLVGPNGAGKSTLLKILLDLVRRSEGMAEVLGVDPKERPALVRANVGYIDEQPGWGYGWMRAGRLLEHHAKYFPSWDSSYAAKLCRIFDVPVDAKMNTLSKGQSRRVHFVLALAHRPPLLVFDEPTDGLDPVMRDEILGTLVEHLADTPTTVLLSTHHVTEIQQLADHIGVMRNGELYAQLPLSELRRDLKRYRAAIPTGWDSSSLLGDAVLRRSTSRNEIDWTIWGEESRIASEFASTGATIRDASPLSLEEATLALLSPGRNTP